MRSLRALALVVPLALGAASVPAGAAEPAPAGAPASKAVPDAALGTLSGDHGLQPGELILDISLPDAKGRRIPLPVLAQLRPLLVVFYRGAGSARCQAQLRELAARYADFEKRGVAIAAISADSPEQAAKTQSDLHLPFFVLSDADHRAQQLFRVEDTARKRALPSAFLFDADIALVWQHVGPASDARLSADQLLRVLESKIPPPDPNTVRVPH